MVFIRNPYNYDTIAASDESALLCVEPSLAQQHFKDECDINVILDRWVKTGEAPNLDRSPQYGDFTGISDYATSLNTVIAANEAFDALPAKLRARFDNDPAKLLQFVSDDSNYDEASQLGLVPARDMSSSSPDRLSSGQAGDEPVYTSKTVKPSKNRVSDGLKGGQGDE